jgi:hypothetical protein
MRLRFQPWQLALLVIAVCALVVGGAWWYRTRGASTPEELVACLPRSDAVVVYVDVDALRNSRMLDLLAGSRATEELEYRQFVEQTGFDYRRDMDRVAAAFARDHVFLVIRGRFDWRRLINYANSNGGQCRGSICRMPSSQPGRSISFFPLRAAVLALAVSRDEWAATEIADRKMPAPLPIGANQPVWISVPGARLRDLNDPLPGTRSFISALSTADHMMFSIGPEADRLAVHADVTCANPQAATALATQLTETTELLRKMLAREKQTPNPSDLSSMLANGAFKAEDRRVSARWPMERALIESLAGGPSK